MTSLRVTNKTIEIEGAELLRFRCNGCGTCCHLWIPVTDEDVCRLIAGTGLTAKKMVEFVEPSRFGASPGTVAWIKFGPRKQDRRVMCLREARNRCLFLRVNRCAVYEYRPVVCREHPFILSLDKTGHRIESIDLNRICDCLHTLDGKVRKNDLKKVHHWSVSQDADYFNKVRRWNRRQRFGSTLDFLRYLGFDE